MELLDITWLTASKDTEEKQQNDRNDWGSWEWGSQVWEKSLHFAKASRLSKYKIEKFRTESKKNHHKQENGSKPKWLTASLRQRLWRVSSPSGLNEGLDPNAPGSLMSQTVKNMRVQAALLLHWPSLLTRHPLVDTTCAQSGPELLCPPLTHDLGWDHHCRRLPEHYPGTLGAPAHPGVTCPEGFKTPSSRAMAIQDNFWRITESCS